MLSKLFFGGERLSGMDGEVHWAGVLCALFRRSCDVDRAIIWSYKGRGCVKYRGDKEIESTYVAN